MAGLATFGLVAEARRRRGRRAHDSLTWLLAGIGAPVLGDATWFVRVDLLGLPAHWLQALPASLAYLALLVAALRLLLAPRPRPSGAVLDSAVIAVSCAVVLWQLVLGPVTERLGMEAGAQRVATLVLLVQAATLGAAVTMHHTSADRPAPLLLFSLATITFTAASLGRAVATAPHSAVEAWWPGPLLIVAYTLVACALLHPSAPGLPDREVRTSGHITSATVIATGSALAVGPSLGIAHEVAAGDFDNVLSAASTLLLVPVVLTRIWLLSRSRDEAEAKLAWMARYDELTGLANRRELGERLTQSVARVQAGEVPAVVVTFCDLNGFKEINDVHGHHVGDEVLTVVARRLTASVRQEDLVARFGGDEFVIVAEGDPAVLASETVRRITEVVVEPVQVGGVTVRVGIATGTAIGTPGTGLDAERLLSAADSAMYRQKRARHGVLRTSQLPRHDTDRRQAG
ncbi:GGDEF domain-containing protein [Actinotalea fermentans]|uniref:GGDEF domain-containing protein n=1 Tax=Actinotalea fermentans TaxID=43671 RepID=A0A511Z000_9CELL|nr:GGDEF domain-containing protein [Actinotalea fermentans]KGM15902.1 hypothetical protein N867_04670 [Actinotalea fermentans ATCC 43279 = JCM 9966 = DSM 3133]GEN80762.1 hypothetical protein AFE02nite_24960 [Actinotalea fermentans]